MIVLPQRQTALAAKQAAEVDLLSGGRLRFGLGVGWNAVEYEALGEHFGNRGRRSEEQMAVLRLLWCQRSVRFEGRYHRITGAGIAPLPVQRPIPLWIGAASAPGWARAGRLADGWFPMHGPGARLDEARGVVDEAARAAGRDPAAVGMEGRVRWQRDHDRTLGEIAEWDRAGATHLSVDTMGAGLHTLDNHLSVLEAIAVGAGLGG